MMLFRLFGSVLLIIGTCIGAGILALPISTAPAGFYASVGLLLFCWAISTCSAFYLLEVNLRLPLNSNIISMAKKTLGRPAEIFAWVVYLLLLYSLIAAYLAGGGDVIQNLTSLLHLHFNHITNTILFLTVFGSLVFFGIHAVDRANRILMLIKLGSFFLVCILASSHTSITLIDEPQHIAALPAAIMVVVTSFGFSIIIPSLRVYLDSNVFYLRLAILISSLIALFCYLAWIFVVSAVVPHQGPIGLTHIIHSSNPVANLTSALIAALNKPVISTFIHIFTTVCVFTSFLTVSLSLSDFLADGLQKEKKGKNKTVIIVATFLPSLLLNLFCPGLFITALRYAGIFCIALLIIMPTLMVKRLRSTASEKNTEAYRVWGGSPLILFTLLGSILLLIFGAPYI